MTSPRRSTLAVAVLFFVNGAAFSNWIPRLAEVRDRMGVSNSGLGGALLGGGLGGFVGSLLVARLVHLSRTRTTVAAGTIIIALLVPLVAVVDSPAMLLLILAAFGFADVQVDVSMNAQAVMVQTRVGRPIMQRLHGAWSLGMVVGGGIGWLLSVLEVPLGTHVLGASIVMLAALGWAMPGLLPSDDPVDDAIHSGGRSGRNGLAGVAVAIGLMGFALAILESLPNEWSSVIMTDVFEAGRWKSAATAFFAAFMLLGRLGGDHAVMALGRQRVFTLGVSLCAASAVLLAVAPVTAVALAAYSLWGLGVSVLFPQLYEFAARLPGVSAATGMGAMTFGQRLGFAFATGALGTVADLLNFRLAVVALVTVALVLIAGSRGRVVPVDQSTATNARH